MNRIWELYENMNEMAYVADMDNYEIVYMNRKTREVYGIQSMEEVKDKKCYEVFQQSATPCAICTNRDLQPGYFKEWKYFNPTVGKNFALKDTMVEENGRNYRIELAIDITEQQQQQETINEYINNEAMINEGLRISLSAPSPDESIAILLEYLGKALQSERVYIFEEVGGNCFSNTYEWCASGVSQEKDNLQNLPFEVVSIWIDRFHDNENVIIRNLDDIKDSDPLMYDCLFPQNIHSLVAGPLFNNNKIIGFYGVDNPPQKMLGNISVLFQIMGHFLGSLLKRRNLVRRLVNLSFYDQLTGCKNRHAMNEYVRELRPRDSIGIIYGDVTGLKKVNDTLGHEAGDQLLIQASDCLKRVFPEDQVFRMGGDEFLVLYSKVTEDELLRQIKLLEADMKEHDVVIAIGYVWRPDSTENIDKLLMEADEQMYENKRAYYEKHQMSRV